MPRDRRATGSLSVLLTAHAISQTGNVITAFGVPFYVLGLGGSGVEVGIAAFFATAPVVIGGALGGVVIDRVGHRRAAIVADLVSGATVLALPVLALTVGLPFWALLILVFAGGLLDTPGQTTRRVMLPVLTVRAGVRIERSVGLVDGSERFAKLVGASIAGLLVALLGPISALFVDAATFAVSALLTWAFVAADPAAVKLNGDSVDEQRSEVQRLKSLGAREVLWDRTPADADYIILEDPEGNRFCVIDASAWPGWNDRNAE